MKKAFLGPMWSRKTFKILSEIRDKDYAIIDCVNSRNSDRDLNNLADRNRIFSDIKYVPFIPETIVIDEVHLYQVLNKEELIFSLLERDCDFILAGIYFDGYQNNRPFEIWNKIFPHMDEIFFLKSRVACGQCGSLKNVFYTKPKVIDAVETEKIGDHYINVCSACVEGGCPPF